MSYFSAIYGSNNPRPKQLNTTNVVPGKGLDLSGIQTGVVNLDVQTDDTSITTDNTNKIYATGVFKKSGITSNIELKGPNPSIRFNYDPVIVGGPTLSSDSSSNFIITTPTTNSSTVQVNATDGSVVAGTQSTGLSTNNGFLTINNPRTDSSVTNNTIMIDSNVAGGGDTFRIIRRQGTNYTMVLNSNIVSNVANHIAFLNGPNLAAAVGSITSNSGATQFNVTSDYRLKENITAADSDTISRLLNAPVRSFNYKAYPDVRYVGFIAHELATVIPNCITGEKDAVDPVNGWEIWQQLDMSKLVPYLVATVQFLNNELNTLKDRVTALETPDNSENRAAALDLNKKLDKKN